MRSDMSKALNLAAGIALALAGGAVYANEGSVAPTKTPRGVCADETVRPFSGVSHYGRRTPVLRWNDLTECRQGRLLGGHVFFLENADRFSESEDGTALYLMAQPSTISFEDGA